MASSEIRREQDIRDLPGGSWILRGRDRARRLLHRLPPESAGGGGRMEGWDGVTRRGRLENLIQSEYLHEEEEFLRRHFDGEQLYLSRQAARTEASAAVLCWDLTTASLGAPRLNALGLALAFRERWTGRDHRFRLMLGPEESCGLSGIEEVRRLLEAPPRLAPCPLKDWLPAIVNNLETTGSGSLYWIAASGSRDLAIELSAARTSRLEDVGIFVVEPRRIELWLETRGESACWKKAASVEWTGRS